MKQSTKFRDSDPLAHIPWIEPVDCFEVPDDCLAELQVISADIPNDMLKYYLRKAMQEFTDRSRIQIRNITINLQACVCDYPITLPHGEEFLSFQRRSLRPMQPHETTTECGGYQFSWDVPSCTVSVAPAPRCQGPVKLQVATAPSIESCLVDRKIFTRHLRTLIHGAKSYLFLMSPNDEVTWANAGLGQYHELKFSAGIAAAATDKILGHSTGPYVMQHRRIV